MSLQVPIANDQIKENALSVYYIRLLQKYFYPCGLWPGAMLGKKNHILTKFPTYMYPAIGGVYIVGGMYYVMQFYESLDFPTFIEVFITTCMSFVTLCRMCLPMFKQYHVIFAKFLLEVHLIHHKHKSDYHNHVYNNVHKLSNRFTKVMHVIMWSGVSTFNILPLFNNYRNGVFSNTHTVPVDMSVKFLLPGFDPQDHVYLVTIYNSYTSFCFGVSLSLIDTLIFLMVFHMVGHIRILANNIRGIKDIGDEEAGVSTNTMTKLYNDETNERISTRLKLCVQEHKFIVNLAKEMSSFLGPILGINYLVHLSACCLLLFEISLADPVTLFRFGMLSAYIFGQLVQISVIFEFFSTESETLFAEMYAVPWEQINLSNRGMVLIMLNRMKDPICVYAIGTVKVGVTTMSEILKTTFSYFLFIKSKNDI